jgi:hypothetical protein
MRYDDLPVFKASYDLVLEVFTWSQHMKREYRYSLGEEVKKELVKLIMSVYRANVTKDKEPHIRAARENIEMVRLQIRLLRDLRQVPIKNVVKVNLHIDEISKQLAAWHRSVEKRRTQQTDENENITEE